MDQNKIKLVVVFPTIQKIHLKRDPLLVPITMMKLGVESVVFAHTSEIHSGSGVPRVITISQYPNTPKSRNPVSYASYFLDELKYSRALLRKIKLEKPDAMLFFYDPIAALIVKMIHPRIKIGYKLDSPETAKLPYPKTIVKFSFLLKFLASDIIVVETKKAYHDVGSFAPFVKSKLKLINNGIPPEFFLRPKERRLNKKIVLSVARINRVKGLDILIKSFAKQHKRHKDWELRIVGPVEDQEYYAELKSLTDALGLSKSVTFLEYVSEKKLRQEYLNASIFCLSSYQEGASAARVEAMAMGIPIICTRTGGSEMVENKGIVVDIGDSGALANALEIFMSNTKLREKASTAELTAAEKMTAVKAAKSILSELGLGANTKERNGTAHEKRHDN